MPDSFQSSNGVRFSTFWGVQTMRSKLVLCVVLGFVSAMYAKEPKHYQSGKLLQMDAVPCGTTEKDGKSLSWRNAGHRFR